MILINRDGTAQGKNVSFCNQTNIFTSITKYPSYVTEWISKITANSNGGRLLIGLDVEWRPNFYWGEFENRVAILQLCVGDRCLIFQIIHSPKIPQSLIDFLNNPNHTFTGVGINADVDKLVRHYGLGRPAGGMRFGANVVDLARLAAERYGYNMNGLSLAKLAGDVLGKKVEKPERVTLSDWANECLSPEQIDYATIDAFLSFEIGRVLLAKDW